MIPIRLKHTALKRCRNRNDLSISINRFLLQFQLIMGFDNFDNQFDKNFRSDRLQTQIQISIFEPSGL